MRENAIKLILRKKFWVFSLYFFNLFILSHAYAATLNINHTKIRLAIEPGSSQSGTIEVENPTAEDMIVKVYAEDWVYTPAHDGEKNFYSPGSMPRSAARWLSFVPSNFIIPALSKQRVNYTIKIPPDSEGVHVAVLFFESAMGKQAAQPGVGLSLILRIGTLFFIETQGKTIRSASLDALSIRKKADDTSFAITMQLKNTGNSDITTEGLFHIMDRKGMIYARGQFNKVFILPGDSSEVNAAASEAIPAGTYDLVMTFDLGKAQLETGFEGGPVLVKEATITVDENGRITTEGDLR